MKILFITDLYPISTDEKGTPQTLHNFVIEWIKQGHKVDVVKPNFVFNSFIRKKPFYKTGFYEYKGVKIFNINYFSPFLFDISKKISRSIDFSDYDVFVAHMPSGIIFANKLAQNFSKPLVCGVHCSDIEVLTNPVYKLYFKSQMKIAYRNAKKIACRSFVLQNKFNKLMPELAEKTFVAASGVGGQVIAKTFVQKPSILKVITCARLIKRKNIDKLILAVKKLQGFELSIVGDGPEMAYLRKISTDSRIKINFLGHLPHEQVLQEIQKSDIFVLPSVNETFGMVYLEAMASGCIVIGTKNDGIDGIVKDGENGFLIEPTVEGINEILLRIKNTETTENIEQITKNSMDTVKKYSEESCAKNYFEQLS